MEESERIFAEELKVKCEKKGLNFEDEFEKHNKVVAETRTKQAEKKRLAKEKADAKAKKAEERKTAKLAKLTTEQLAKREERTKRRQERDDASWAIEREKGEAYYQKIQAELATKQEK